MPRKCLLKAEKRVRVTDETFSKWRLQRDSLGFQYDDEYAQYLLRVGESLQKMNMLDQKEGGPTSADVDVESSRTEVEPQDLNSPTELDTDMAQSGDEEKSDNDNPGAPGVTQTSIKAFKQTLAPPKEAKNNDSDYSARKLDLGWCTAEYDRQQVLSGIMDQKRFIAHLLNSHNQWCSTCRTSSATLTASNLAQDKSEFTASIPELNIPTSWESKKWFEDLNAHSNMSITSFLLHLLLIYSHWHSIPLPGGVRLAPELAEVTMFAGMATSQANHRTDNQTSPQSEMGKVFKRRKLDDSALRLNDDSSVEKDLAKEVALRDDHTVLAKDVIDPGNLGVKSNDDPEHSNYLGSELAAANVARAVGAFVSSVSQLVTEETTLKDDETVVKVEPDSDKDVRSLPYTAHGQCGQSAVDNPIGTESSPDSRRFTQSRPFLEKSGCHDAESGNEHDDIEGTSVGKIWEWTVTLNDDGVTSYPVGNEETVEVSKAPSLSVGTRSGKKEKMLVSCSICFKLFATRRALEEHDRATRCRFCGYTVSREMITGTDGCTDVMKVHRKSQHPQEYVSASSTIRCKYKYCDFRIDREVIKSAAQRRITLAAHVEECHPEYPNPKVVHKCEFCDYSVTLETGVKSASNCLADLATHKIENHREKFQIDPKPSQQEVKKVPVLQLEMTCKICSKVLVGNSKYQAHMGHHKRSMTCPYCDFVLAPEDWRSPDQCRTVMGNHRKENHPEHFQRYLCDICGRGLATPESLQLHKVDIHGFDLDSAKRKCHICEEVFPSYKQLQYHVERKHSENLPCTFSGCVKVFPNTRRRNTHVRKVHVKTFRFACTHEGCVNRFSEESHLKRHMEQVHLQQRSFFCDFPGCGKSFYAEYNLRVHKRVHSKEKPLKCPHCDYRANQRNSMNWHLKKHEKRHAVGTQNFQSFAQRPALDNLQVFPGLPITSYSDAQPLATSHASSSN
ncbi:uncharacterized protein LOC135497363 isoform X3 [Lineus longissimus]|uniref:uncharacterized protein LOC135497363 isoform X3 n=1 Tax=Lineus longissimus TaxID=88925 RepID=UPI00315DBA47